MVRAGKPIGDPVKTLLPPHHPQAMRPLLQQTLTGAWLPLWMSHPPQSCTPCHTSRTRTGLPCNERRGAQKNARTVTPLLPTVPSRASSRKRHLAAFQHSNSFTTVSHSTWRACHL